MSGWPWFFGGGTQYKPARTGLVRSDHRKILDGLGAFFPLGFSFFWAMWGWKHDRTRTEKNLAYMAARGFDFFRYFLEVGGDSWSDRVIDPRDSDHEVIHADFVDTAYHKYGLRGEATIFGGGTGAPFDLTTDKFRNVMQSRQYMIQDVEICNEDNGPDQTEQRRQVQRIRSWFPGLVATSSFGNRDSDVVNLCTDHFERNLSDGDWRCVRQPWDAKDYPYPDAQNEPIGPGSSVAQLSDPLRLAMLRAVGIECGVPSFVLHCGAGIRGGGWADMVPDPGGKPWLPRHANFWEYDLDPIINALHMVGSLVPENAPNWRKTRHTWPDHPLNCGDIWPDGLDHGVVRIHAAYGDGKFVVMPIGVKHYADLRAKDHCHFTVRDPITGVVVDEQTLPAGAVYHLVGADDAKASAAFVIVGEVL